MQCKDIPTEPILRHVASFNGAWCNWYFADEKSVTHAMPPGIPDKLIVAKMRNLIDKGLLNGCGCGCRGDYTITAKGRARIGLARGPLGLEHS